MKKFQIDNKCQWPAIALSQNWPKDQNKKQQQWTQKQKFLTDLRFIELYPNPAELSSNSLAKLYFRHPISRGSPYVQIFSPKFKPQPPKFKPLATSKSTSPLSPAEFRGASEGGLNTLMEWTPFVIACPRFNSICRSPNVCADQRFAPHRSHLN